MQALGGQDWISCQAGVMTAAREPKMAHWVKVLAAMSDSLS